MERKLSIVKINGTKKCDTIITYEKIDSLRLRRSPGSDWVSS